MFCRIKYELLRGSISLGSIENHTNLYNLSTINSRSLLHIFSAKYTVYQEIKANFHVGSFSYQILKGKGRPEQIFQTGPSYIMKLTPQEKAQLDCMLSRFRKHEKIREMKNYIQHGHITTYEHCEQVTELCFLINRRFKLKADENKLVTGALLHDFYLYDWHHDDGGSHRLHGFFHPAKASENAKKYFDVDKDVAEIIQHHMWPLTFFRIPRSREAWIVCMADKIVSTRETLMERK